MRCVETVKTDDRQVPTFVMITSSSLGKPSVLMAFPSISSVRPLEYPCAQITSEARTAAMETDTHVRGVESLDTCVVASRWSSSAVKDP